MDTEYTNAINDTSVLRRRIAQYEVEFSEIDEKIYRLKHKLKKTKERIATGKGNKIEHYKEKRVLTKERRERLKEKKDKLVAKIADEDVYDKYKEASERQDIMCELFSIFDGSYTPKVMLYKFTRSIIVEIIQYAMSLVAFEDISDDAAAFHKKLSSEAKEDIAVYMGMAETFKFELIAAIPDDESSLFIMQANCSDEKDYMDMLLVGCDQDDVVSEMKKEKEKVQQWSTPYGDRKFKWTIELQGILLERHK